MAGHFVISLDFELHWGVFDKKSVDDYIQNLEHVPEVIDRLLEMAAKYDIKITFSTVGLLFAKDKTDIRNFSPKNLPTYHSEKLNPYRLIDSIGHDEIDDPFHYAYSTIKKIRDYNDHEIGTHTFSHFYCHEPGQTSEQFNDDLEAVVNIAKPLDINIRSIVFPKNQINPNDSLDQPYLYSCKNHGITNFRGKEKASIYNIHTKKVYYNFFVFRALKFLDAYINITGNNTYDLKAINKNSIILNIPSSRFLRPYMPKLKYVERLKINRILKGMTYAAKHEEVYHLWWHPHNFGTHIEENFKNLETIFKTYQTLHKTYAFQSETMSGLAEKCKYDLKTYSND